MRSYERSGITVDQCTSCRGVFLDRGELEKLVDAEGSYYEKSREPQRERERDHDREREQDRYREHDRDRSPLSGFGGFGGGGHGRGKRKKESFLSELFD
jgi:hypothetical protein